MERKLFIEVSEEEYQKIKNGALEEKEPEQKEESGLEAFPYVELVREVIRRSKITNDRFVEFPDRCYPVHFIEGNLTSEDENAELEFVLKLQCTEVRQ